MTDIIKFNDTHTPKTEIGMKKFELAEALTAISDLQNPYRLTELSTKERYALYNKSMRKVCDILDIDLDMHEMMKTGSEGFSYSDSVESTEELKYILDNKVVYSREIENEDQPQNTVKSIVKTLQDISLRPWEYAKEDIDVLGDIIYSYVTDLCNALGFEDMSETYTENSKNTIKEQLQELYSLNDSMFGDDIHALPRFTDGSEIKAKDLADMNLHALDLIAELLGFELEEGATQLVQPQADKPASKMSDQEIYDSLPAEDKLDVDMLNKLHEVQDHILKSGQTAVGANRITTAVTLLEAGLGVIDHEEG